MGRRTEESLHRGGVGDKVTNVGNALSGSKGQKILIHISSQQCLPGNQLCQDGLEPEGKRGISWDVEGAGSTETAVSLGVCISCPSLHQTLSASSQADPGT